LLVDVARLALLSFFLSPISLSACARWHPLRPSYATQEHTLSLLSSSITLFQPSFALVDQERLTRQDGSLIESAVQQYDASGCSRFCIPIPFTLFSYTTLDPSPACLADRKRLNTVVVMPPFSRSTSRQPHVMTSSTFVQDIPQTPRPNSQDQPRQRCIPAHSIRKT
jgi:hypothetical protein